MQNSALIQSSAARFLHLQTELHLTLGSSNIIYWTYRLSRHYLFEPFDISLSIQSTLSIRIDDKVDLNKHKRG